MKMVQEPICKYRPAEAKKDNGHTFHLSLTATGTTETGTGSASATLKTKFTLGTDKVRYNPSRISFADDKFAVEWIGDRNGGQEAFTGCCREERPAGTGRGFHYNFHLAGGKYAKTV